MKRLISSSAVRLVGLWLLAMAIVFSPESTRASASAGKCDDPMPFAACQKCYGVPQYDGTVCNVLTCVAAEPIFSNCG